MATGGYLGNGVKVGYSSSSPVSWTKVAQLMDTKFPTITPDEVDNTVHSTGGFKRSFPGLKSVDKMELTLLADLNPATTASHAALRTLQTAGTTLWWRIEVPVDRAQSQYVAFEYQGPVFSWNLETPIDDKQMVKVAVSFDGTEITMYAPGASAIA